MKSDELMSAGLYENLCGRAEGLAATVRSKTTNRELRELGRLMKVLLAEVRRHRPEFRGIGDQ